MEKVNLKQQSYWPHCSWHPKVWLSWACWAAQGAQCSALPQLGSHSGAQLAPSSRSVTAAWCPWACWGQQSLTGAITVVLRASRSRNPQQCHWEFHPLQADLVLLPPEDSISPFMPIPQAVKMKIFSSLVSLKLVCFLGRTSQAFPIICREISYNCEGNFINRENKTVVFKSLLAVEKYLANHYYFIPLSWTTRGNF